MQISDTTAEMTLRELDVELLEYPHGLSPPKVIGKMWKLQSFEGKWWLGEYIKGGVKWRRILVLPKKSSKRNSYKSVDI
jgi:hypothetical protein